MGRCVASGDSCVQVLVYVVRFTRWALTRAPATVSSRRSLAIREPQSNSWSTVTWSVAKSSAKCLPLVSVPTCSLYSSVHLLTLFLCLSVHLPVRPSFHPSIHLPIHSSIHLPTSPSVHPLTHPSSHLAIHLSVHPSIHSSIRLPIRSSAHPSAHPSVHLPVHSCVQYLRLTLDPGTVYTLLRYVMMSINVAVIFQVEKSQCWSSLTIKERWQYCRYPASSRLWRHQRNDSTLW